MRKYSQITSLSWVWIYRLYEEFQNSVRKQHKLKKMNKRTEQILYQRYTADT